MTHALSQAKKHYVAFAMSVAYFAITIIIKLNINTGIGNQVKLSSGMYNCFNQTAACH